MKPKLFFPSFYTEKKNTSSFLSSIQKNVSKYYVDFIIGRKTDTFKDCHGLFKQTDLPQRIYRQTWIRTYEKKTAQYYPTCIKKINTYQTY